MAALSNTIYRLHLIFQIGISFVSSLILFCSTLFWSFAHIWLTLCLLDFVADHSIFHFTFCCTFSRSLSTFFALFSLDSFVLSIFVHRLNSFTIIFYSKNQMIFRFIRSRSASFFVVFCQLHSCIRLIFRCMNFHFENVSAFSVSVGFFLFVNLSAMEFQLTKNTQACILYTCTRFVLQNRK